MSHLKFSVMFLLYIFIVNKELFSQNINYIDDFQFENSGVGIHIFGNYIYESWVGLNVYDIENNSIERVFHDDNVSIGMPILRNDVLYSGGYYSFTIVNISNPSEPELISAIDEDNESYTGYPVIYDHFLFVVELRDDQILIYDIEDINQPIRVDSLEFNNFDPKGMQLVDNLLFIG
ncbi:hypothetical protein K8I28_09830, partial [bacterium]|nr:hypothetical protein [bacterium]